MVGTCCQEASQGLEVVEKIARVVEAELLEMVGAVQELPSWVEEAERIAPVEEVVHHRMAASAAGPWAVVEGHHRVDGNPWEAAALPFHPCEAELYREEEEE
jgi:hypothetical protein